MCLCIRACVCVWNEAQDHLWKAQCNCAYWHGVFGGLYLPHLRHGIFENLIAADKIISGVLHPFEGTFDVDNDGYEEVDLVSDNIKIIASTKGACIREFDILKKNFNILNTMHQVGESYHRDLSIVKTDRVTSGSIHSKMVAKEANLDKILNVDEYPRYMLMDHFYPLDTNFEAVKQRSKEEGDFSENEFNVLRDAGIVFKTVGKAFGKDISIEKNLFLNGNKLSISIFIQNIDSSPVNGLYGAELNYSLLGGHTDDRYFKVDGKKPSQFYLDTEKAEQDINRVDIVNEYDGFTVSTIFTAPTNLWRFPVFTVSGSESGLEKVYQSSVLIPYWEIKLAPTEQLKMEFNIIIEED